MNFGNQKNEVLFSGRARRRSALSGMVKIRGLWRAVHRDRFGKILSVDEWQNVVTDEGLNYALDAALSGGTPITSWYLALLKTSPSPATTSTYQNYMGTGNQEVTAYDEATREAWVDGGVSGKSVDNVSSVATFTISANSTVIGGAALVSESTKGANGAGPVLYAAGAFAAGDKTLDDDDTLDVTATFTTADDGA